MKKLSPIWEPYIFVAVMAFGMSAVVSFVNIILNIGFVDHLGMIWFSSWIKAFLIALVPAFFMRKISIFILGKVINRN